MKRTLKILQHIIGFTYVVLIVATVFAVIISGIIQFVAWEYIEGLFSFAFRF